MENEIKKLTLEELGYGSFFESSRVKLKLDDLLWRE